MTQTSNSYPQHLKGLIIVFTGEFRPYCKSKLINMCQKLGAKTSNLITYSTSALIQGSFIQGFYGKVQHGRDINSTNKTRQALRKNVPIIPNDKMDEFFVSKTGKTVAQIMKIIQNPFLSAHQTQKSSIINYFSTTTTNNNNSHPTNVLQKTPKYEQKNTYKNNNNKNNKSTFNKNEKQKYANSVIQQLYKYNFHDVLDNKQTIRQIKKIAIDYLIGESNFDHVFQQAQYYVQKMSRRLHIAEIMRQVKRQLFGIQQEDPFKSKTIEDKLFVVQSQEKLKQLFGKKIEQQQPRQQLAQNKGFKSQIDCFIKETNNQTIELIQLNLKQNKQIELKPCTQIVSKHETNQLKSQILSSFQILNEEFNKNKGVCYQSFNDISDEINEILNSSNLKVIHEKANSLKTLTEKCFSIYRTLSKSMNNYGNQLKALVQIQNEEISKNDPISLSTQRTNKIVEKDEDKVQRLSKKDQLAIKKQSKQNEKIYKETQQANLQLLTQGIQNKMKDNIYIQSKQFELLLPAQKYLQIHFPQYQHQRRYRMLSKSDSQLQQLKFDNVYYLDHSQVEINMQEFIRYDWRNVERFNFTKCQLTSEDWNAFCQNFSLFPSLGFLVLASNNIIQVQQQQLIKLLPHMKAIHFGSIDKPQKRNPLTQQSIKQIEKFLNRKDQQKFTILYK